MHINELLLVEFDEEMKKTRTMLERVPEDKKDFAPHPDPWRWASSRLTWRSWPALVLRFLQPLSLISQRAA